MNSLSTSPFVRRRRATPDWLVAVACALLVSLAASCAPEEPFDESSRNDEVVRGEVTWDHPEIGRLEIRHGSSVGICTATLVANNVAITAAHCVSYSSATTPSNYGSFIVRAAATEPERRYTVQRYIAFASRLGADDLALLHLADAVPESVARPAPLANASPDAGTPLAVYGYGCTRRGGGLDGAKRRANFAQGEVTNRLCPGDSGGPVIVAATGAVLRINSGYYGDSFGTDLFGDVPRNFERVAAQIRAWSGSDPGTGGTPAPADCGTFAGSAQWTCVGNARVRCVEGVRLERQTCAYGCNAVPGGAAECAPAPTPSPSPTPSPDRCGIYAPFPNYTCRRGGTGFARCVPGSVPEFLTCPAGYGCQPGSQLLRCYRF